jgi:uncharacterized membrane protein
MLRSVLMGIVAGQRALTPLAALAWAARAGKLDPDAPGVARLGSGLGTVGATGLALAELAGDKLPTAPDRIVPSGLAARLLTGGYAGAVLAREGERRAGALAGAASAILASYVGFGARRFWMARFGQVPTGLVEDALVATAAARIVAAPR